MIFEKNETVREIAIRHPESVRVFETLGIDYCCGGKRPLAEACKNANVPLAKLLEMLGELEAKAGGEEQWSPEGASAAELAAHIVERHHGFVRAEAPRLQALAAKVVTRHGQAHAELGPIQDAFEALVEELSGHMMKEERILFPFIAQMEKAIGNGGPAPAGCFPSVEFPISRMLAEHEDAGALTARIRELAGGFQAPADACPTYRALYHGLEQFERDLHYHIHLENNILFPRTVEMERRLQESADVSVHN
ncbi:MAG TPA: iron-sulfur cluster repair di-iron protein [Bryobacteraceae bacterium]|nr:iron-sulfur cluster repair di-iron protein [Bryobacteraceae bacterium]